MTRYLYCKCVAKNGMLRGQAILKIVRSLEPDILSHMSSSIGSSWVFQSISGWAEEVRGNERGYCHIQFHP
jgi:hypothetical protein